MTPAKTSFTVTGLGAISDLRSDMVWQRESNPFRTHPQRLLAGEYSCVRFRLPAQSASMLRAVEDGRERAYYLVSEGAGYVATRRS